MAVTQQLDGFNFDALTVTIANGASLSDAAEVNAGDVVGIIVPTFTSAAVTFSVSADGSTYVDLFDNAATPAEVTLPAGTHNKGYLAPLALAAFPFLKVRSGTAALPANQGAARTVTLVVQAVVS